jgi:hypothetical protein
MQHHHVRLLHVTDGRSDRQVLILHSINLSSTTTTLLTVVALVIATRPKNSECIDVDTIEVSRELSEHVVWDDLIESDVKSNWVVGHLNSLDGEDPLGVLGDSDLRDARIESSDVMGWAVLNAVGVQLVGP